MQGPLEHKSQSVIAKTTRGRPPKSSEDLKQTRKEPSRRRELSQRSGRDDESGLVDYPPKVNTAHNRATRYAARSQAIIAVEAARAVDAPRPSESRHETRSKGRVVTNGHASQVSERVFVRLES